ncbi:MAG: hypothetical protein WBZ51_21700, partial [Xanthobacteraceae bacterium]
MPLAICHRPAANDQIERLHLQLPHGSRIMPGAPGRADLQSIYRPTSPAQRQAHPCSARRLLRAVGALWFDHPLAARRQV